MHFSVIQMSDTVIAYDVSLNGRPLGQVFLRDEYWHTRSGKTGNLTQSGAGFTLARGYESKGAAATALAKELVTP